MSESRRVYVEPQREIPISWDGDVVVAGGGPGGLGAAIGAAREGARVLLVERNSFLGGTATAGLMANFLMSRPQMTGVFAELVDRLLASGGALAGRIVIVDPEAFKQSALSMCLEAGVELLFYTMASRPIVEGSRVRGVVVENKSGRQALLGSVTVDTTGDADIAVRAGAEYVVGREEDGKMRPMSTLFRLGNVDVERIVQYCRENPGQFALSPYSNVIEPERGVYRFEGFYDLVETARARGELDADCHYLRLEGVQAAHGTVIVNTTRVYGLDGADAFQLTRGELEARKQMTQLIEFIRKHIPGCERAFLIDASANLGVRETRRVIGDYVFSDEDVGARRVFEDTIAHIWRRHRVGQDMHSPDAGEGLRPSDYREQLARYTPDAIPPAPDVDYYFPYRSLIPRELEGILVAGRGMSINHLGDTWTRPMFAVTVFGQAAGAAAALAAKSGSGVREIDILELQRRLARQGVDLGEKTPR